MSGPGCTVDTSLSETFIHERIVFGDEVKSEPSKFGSLIDFYTQDTVLCSSFVWKNEVEPLKKKSSSLKTSRAQSSSEKKIVRFADVLGLDLADVHTFLDEIPKIPKSAFKDLKTVDVSPIAPKPEKTLTAMFPQPASKLNFIERLTQNKVCLENAFVTNTTSLNVRGTIRVVNVDFEKNVSVRYTFDKWKTYVDSVSQYLESPPDGFSDRFSFTLPASNMSVGQRMEFAVNYKVAGKEFWDNNLGGNYTFQCVPDNLPKSSPTQYIPSSIALENWGSFY